MEVERRAKIDMDVETGGACVLLQAEHDKRTLTFHVHINYGTPLDFHSLTQHMRIQHQQHAPDRSLGGVGGIDPVASWPYLLQRASSPALSLGGGPCTLYAAGAASVRTPGRLVVADENDLSTLVHTKQTAAAQTCICVARP